MLQPVLAERFQLREHKTVKERSVYNLEIAGSSKLTESKPNAAGNYETLMQARVGGEFLAKGLTMKQIITNITYFAGRPVIDRTSLDGHYDFDLKWSDTQAPSGFPDNPVNDGPSFFTALTEQLGLKLVPAHAMFDVVVIDNLERPTPN
jgi:bla regulator protein BlaR1